ncbi:MAG: hypothetical protein GY698_12985 [Actinomycetia bacterium]|nr:hypothetical protein [Actinomycetes bacterium]
MLLNLGHLGIRGVDWGREAAPHGIRYRYPLLDKRVASGRQAQYFDIPRIQEQLPRSHHSQSAGGAVAASWIGVRR